jgi:DNA helicase-2/ATP-dependent DNA helicase PcrA
MIANPDAEAASAFADLASEDPEVGTHAGLAADLIGLPEGEADRGEGQPEADQPEEDQPEDPAIVRWRREAALLLAEREERTRRGGPIEVALPPHLSVSQLVVLRRDPLALARSLRRPVPQRPAPFARRGTAFHAWLEQRYGSIRLLDVDELPGAADDDAAADDELAALQQAFLAGEWADRTPVEIEVPFAATVGGVVVRGRMDAVFAEPGGRFDVIDWKTGRRPEAAGASAAAVQLAAYRIAWASLARVPVTRVRAGFHYVREGVTVRPADLPDAAALAALVESLPRAS